MSKGIFWFPCFVGMEGELIFTGEIEALLVPCDEDGNREVPASLSAYEYNSRNGRSNTHKDSWKAVTAGRKDLRGISWNYFPRGRVEISRGRAFVFMNPAILNCDNYLEGIREKFGIGHLDIRVKTDNSAHYQCTILEDKENCPAGLCIYGREKKSRRPGKQMKGEADRPRDYVRELGKPLRQGEKRLARENREMENVLKRKGG